MYRDMHCIVKSLSEPTPVDNCAQIYRTVNNFVDVFYVCQR